MPMNLGSSGLLGKIEALKTRTERNVSLYTVNCTYTSSPTAGHRLPVKIPWFL